MKCRFRLLGRLTRHDGPILRDPIADVNYEVASDAYVFFDEKGALRMIYSGDDGGNASIKLATATDWDEWTIDATLHGMPGPGFTQKETS